MKYLKIIWKYLKMLKDSFRIQQYKILEEEIKKGNVPGERNMKDLTKRMNTYSTSKS